MSVPRHPKSRYHKFRPHIELWTQYDEDTGKHTLFCPLCPVKVTGGTTGGGYRMEQHIEAFHDDKPASSEVSVCRGAPYEWQLGSFWDSYPYQDHITRDLPWTPSAFDAEANTIFFQSKKCTGIVTDNHESCNACRIVLTSKAFIEIIDRATAAKPSTPYNYLTHRQLVALARALRTELQLSRSKVRNTRISQKTWKRRAREHERIMLYLANNDIPRLRWLLTVALKRGTSPIRLLSTLTRAVDGLYRARGYSQAELDISFLVCSLGGPRLLYALSRSHGLVSKRTISRKLRVPHLRFSLKRPSKLDIDTNISSLCDPDVLPVPVPLKTGNPLPGHIAMFDGIALDPRARYCPWRNAVGGLSRETADKVDLVAETMESVDRIHDALCEKTVRFGSEATVVAIGPYAESDYYTPVPLVVSPSDKTEKGPALADWMQTVLDCWKSHEYGQILRGPIWSLGSDGDSTYRWAKHSICTTTKIDSLSPLGRILSPLLGFNLYTSADGLTTSTCDPKHIIKRFATLLRSTQGVVLFGANIRPSDTLLHLSTLTNMSREAALELLDPADKQNVPKAVKLMQCLQKLEPVAIGTPAEYVRRDILRCFSDVLWYFVHPFIDVDMSLQEQLESLSAFSHAIDILYIRHRLSCLTGPLFADTKATIKNIYVVTARLKILDPDHLFYIILEGTDRLENEFSEVRTLDHARNFDIAQLGSKLSTAFLIHAILQRNPHLDRGHRRLDLSKVMGLDRVNPKSWKGNVCVKDVDLAKAWARGRELALERLTEVFGDSARVDFASHYANPAYDMLRPLGDYVGVSADPVPDDVRSERVEPVVSDHIIHAASVLPQPLQSATAPAQQEPTGSVSPHSVEDHPFPSHPISPSLVDPALLQQLADESTLPLGTDLDDYFPDDIASSDSVGVADQSSMSESGTLPNGEVFSKVFLDEDGGKVWKSAYIATLSDDRAKKVSVRTLRAQGVSLEDLRQRSRVIPLEESTAGDADAVKVGDVMGFLARVGPSYTLVILEIVAFNMKGGDRRLSLTWDEFEKASSDNATKIVGQILELDQVEPSRWTWTGAYLTVDGNSSATYSHKRVLVEVPPQLLHFLAPELGQHASSRKSAPTWIFSSSHLQNTLTEAWDALEPESERIFLNIQTLPTIANERQLPYRSRSGVSAFIVQNVPAHLTPEPKHDSKDIVSCYLCEKTEPISKMRNHVSRHIIRAFRGIKDAELVTDVGPNPCGFCGRDQCLTSVSFSKTGAATIVSSCGYQHTGMKYAHAKVSTVSSNSSNVPIHCPLCPPSKALCARTIWKYNAAMHIEQEHQDGSFDAASIAGFFVATHIAREEEERFGISTEATQLARTQSNFPNSDDVRGYEASLAASAGKKQTRPRAPTDEADKGLKPLPKFHARMDSTQSDRPVRSEKR